MRRAPRSTTPSEVDGFASTAEPITREHLLAAVRALEAAAETLRAGGVRDAGVSELLAEVRGAAARSPRRTRRCLVASDDLRR